MKRGKMKSGDQRWACSLTWVSEKLLFRRPFVSGPMKAYKWQTPQRGMATTPQYVVLVKEILVGVYDHRVDHWYVLEDWQKGLPENWFRQITLPEHSVVDRWTLDRINTFGALYVVQDNIRRAL